MQMRAIPLWSIALVTSKGMDWQNYRWRFRTTSRALGDLGALFSGDVGVSQRIDESNEDAKISSGTGLGRKAGMRTLVLPERRQVPGENSARPT
jgi:hypothetical protein